MAPLQPPPSFKFQLFFWNQPFVGVDVHEVSSASFDIIFENVALPLPPTSLSANHGLSMDLHLSIGETTSQAIVVVGDHVELSELKKKTYKSWVGNQSNLLGLMGC